MAPTDVVVAALVVGERRVAVELLEHATVTHASPATAALAHR
ncbi:MAG TPA: hypothetical protein VGO03_12390 [Acidimicrobiia bacterium]